MKICLNFVHVKDIVMKKIGTFLINKGKTVKILRIYVSVKYYRVSRDKNTNMYFICTNPIFYAKKERCECLIENRS